MNMGLDAARQAAETVLGKYRDVATLAMRDDFAQMIQAAYAKGAADKETEMKPRPTLVPKDEIVEDKA
jgi:hypothetical protein